MAQYDTNAGPRRGPFRYGDVKRAVDVFDSSVRRLSIGVAVCIGHDVAGVAHWRLVVSDEVQPGMWYVRNRKFHMAE
jgi:hypothetical protein